MFLFLPLTLTLSLRGEREIFRKMFLVYCFLFLEKSIIRHMVYKDVILED